MNMINPIKASRDADINRCIDAMIHCQKIPIPHENFINHYKPEPSKKALMSVLLEENDHFGVPIFDIFWQLLKIPTPPKLRTGKYTNLGYQLEDTLLSFNTWLLISWNTIKRSEMAFILSIMRHNISKPPEGVVVPVEWLGLIWEEFEVNTRFAPTDMASAKHQMCGCCSKNSIAKYLVSKGEMSFKVFLCSIHKNTFKKPINVTEVQVIYAPL